MRKDAANLKNYEDVMKMRETGKSAREISELLNLSLSTIHHWVYEGTKPREVWGKKFNDLLISKTLRGEKHPLYGKIGVLNPNFGIKRSDETKHKLSITKLGEKNPMWKGNQASKASGQSRARRIITTKKGHEIHHKNGDDLDNSLENLQVVTRKEHMEIDGRLDGKCPHCGRFTGNPNYCNSCGRRICK